MGEYKITAMNGEWMNDWFAGDDDTPAWKVTFRRDEVDNDTAATASRLASLIRATDADVIALAEAPSRPAELALFVQDYLSTAGRREYEFIIGDSGAAQKLAVLWKPGQVGAIRVPDAEVTDLIEEWDADVDGNGVPDLYRFTRTPLVARLDIDGRPLELVVAHLKSNFINHGRELWDDPATRVGFVLAALKNRRRIANEAMRIRTFLDRRLATDPRAAICVLGDLNDGPGRDYFEEKFLAHNVTDLIVGSPWRPERVFRHAQADVPEEERFSAVFDDYVTDEKDKPLLLDHIMCSPGLSRRGAPLRRVAHSGSIEHTAWGKHVTNGGARRDERATDHRPVSVMVAA